MKKTLSGIHIGIVTILALLIFICAFTQQTNAASSGDCGANATWELDDSGNLVISGSGEMDDYAVSDDKAPWIKGNTYKIKSIKVTDGITKIGDCAFSGLFSVTDVEIADTVNLIGENAFSQCESIAKLDIPSSVKEIGSLAFSECTGLETLILRVGLEEIEDDAIYGCTNLKQIHYTGSEEDWGSVLADNDYRSLMEYYHGNKWDSGKVTKKPTCSAEGTKTHTCTVCEDTMTETIAKDASAHSYGKWVKLNNKEHQRVCKYNKSHVAKQGHKWVTTKCPTVAPTPKKKGMQRYTCSVCGAVKEKSIPKLKLKVLRAGTTSVKSDRAVIKWNKVSGAERYRIYFGECGKNKPKLVKTVKANTTSYEAKSIEYGKPYKFIVVAQKKINGRWEDISKTHGGHIVSTYNWKYTNPKGIKLTKSNAVIKKGKSFTIKATVQKTDSNRALLSESHGKKLRYISSDNKIAKVNPKGKVTAVGKGKCTVYVFAINGISKAVKITVK